MSNLAGSTARTWGRAIASYGLWVMRLARFHTEGKADIPTGPVIFVDWHCMNLMAVAFYHMLHRARVCQSFVPPGLVGASVCGWVEGSGIEPVQLPKDGTGNARAALQHMTHALAAGSDVVISLDGPHGPAGRVRPGALWLASMTGCPLVPAAFAARPALRLPRWDRHLVPLPGAQIAVVFGAPVRLERNTKIDRTHLETVGAKLDEATRRAWKILAWSLHRTANLDMLPESDQ